MLMADGNLMREQNSVICDASPEMNRFKIVYYLSYCLYKSSPSVFTAKDLDIKFLILHRMYHIYVNNRCLICEEQSHMDIYSLYMLM